MVAWPMNLSSPPPLEQTLQQWITKLGNINLFFSIAVSEIVVSVGVLLQCDRCETGRSFKSLLFFPYASFHL